jgi:PAS domain-containing protein
VRLVKKDEAAGRKQYESPTITRVPLDSPSSKTQGTPGQETSPGHRSNVQFRIVLNLEGRFQQVSQEFCDLVGYEPQQVLGKRIDEVTVSRTVNIPQHLGAVAQFGNFHCLWMFAHSGGQAILVRCDWEVFPDASIAVECELLPASWWRSA